MKMRSFIPEANDKNVNTAPSHQTPTTNQQGGGVNRIQGWRKQCLYVIIALLMILISVNVSLTLWILKVMELSASGIGGLKITSNGVRLEGQAIILDELRTSNLHSRQGQPITFESSRNITFNTRDADGMLENQLFLGHDKLEVQTKSFRVADIHGNSLFHVDQDAVEIDVDELRILGEGGVHFDDSIQTKLVKAETGKDLKLESTTRSLELHAAQEVFIHSKAGQIVANSLSDIKLRSNTGSIRLSADNIIFTNVKKTQPSLDKRHVDHLAMHKIFQVCVCDNGKLFLSPSDSKCTVSDASVCR